MAAEKVEVKLTSIGKSLQATINGKVFEVSFSEEGIFIGSIDGIAVKVHKQNAILIISPTQD